MITTDFVNNRSHSRSCFLNYSYKRLPFSKGIQSFIDIATSSSPRINLYWLWRILSRSKCPIPDPCFAELLKLPERIVRLSSLTLSDDSKWPSYVCGHVNAQGDHAICPWVGVTGIENRKSVSRAQPCFSLAQKDVWRDCFPHVEQKSCGAAPDCSNLANNSLGQVSG